MQGAFRKNLENCKINKHRYRKKISILFQKYLLRDDAQQSVFPPLGLVLKASEKDFRGSCPSVGYTVYEAQITPASVLNFLAYKNRLGKAASEKITYQNFGLCKFVSSNLMFPGVFCPYHSSVERNSLHMCCNPNCIKEAHRCGFQYIHTSPPPSRYL